MNCRRIEKLIPLYVEGDLEGRKEETVSSHLGNCERCRLLRDEYINSQRALHAHALPEFDIAFFDSLRRGVLSEIEKAESRPSFFRLVTAHWKPAIAAIALLIVFTSLAFYLSRFSAKDMQETDRIVTRDEPKNETPPTERSPEDAIGIGVPITAKTETRTGTDDSKRRKSQRRNTPSSNTEYEGIIAFQPEEVMESNPTIEPMTVSQPEEIPERESAIIKGETISENTLKIEIQTSDPNIRIIWFAPQKADPNPSTLVLSAEEQKSRRAEEPLHSITQSHLTMLTIQEVLCLQ